jgi:hypothetical protein
MLDAVNKDGSPGGPDEFLNSTLNVTNRIDPQSMSQVIIENLLVELDAPEVRRAFSTKIYTGGCHWFTRLFA